MGDFTIENAGYFGIILRQKGVAIEISKSSQEDIYFRSHGNASIIVSRYSSDDDEREVYCILWYLMKGIVGQYFLTSDQIKDFVDKSIHSMEKLHVADSLDSVIDIFRRSNKYIDETMPWVLAKDGNIERLKTVIYNLLETIRIGATLLTPFLTSTSDKIFEQLNTNNREYESVFSFGKLESGNKLGDPKPLFLRIDKEEKLKEILG